MPAAHIPSGKTSCPLRFGRARLPARLGQAGRLSPGPITIPRAACVGPSFRAAYAIIPISCRFANHCSNSITGIGRAYL